MGIQRNENSFFTWDFKVVSDEFSWNLEFDPDDSISHYSQQPLSLLSDYMSAIKTLLNVTWSKIAFNIFE